MKTERGRVAGSVSQDPAPWDFCRRPSEPRHIPSEARRRAESFERIDLFVMSVIHVSIDLFQLLVSFKRDKFNRACVESRRLINSRTRREFGDFGLFSIRGRLGILQQCAR